MFRCAVDIVGPSNLKTLIETVPPYWAPMIAQFHTPGRRPGEGRRLPLVPLPAVAGGQIRIPLLIAQGANDPRVKQAESEQIVAALREAGIDHEYMLFPDEGHGFAKPENRLRFYAAAENGSWPATSAAGPRSSQGEGVVTAWGNQDEEWQGMVELKTDAALDAMREAGRVVAHALAAAREAAAVGTRLTELDEVAHDVLRQAGARSPFLHYHPSFAPTPFPAVICASVNDVIVHGIPDKYRLRDGDLVSIDFGAELDGWTGDAAVSFTVGRADAADLLLIETAEKALAAGVAAAVAGARIGDISAAIGAVGHAAGYGIPAGFGGHGIGRRMHEDPHVPNDGRPGRGMRLRPGLVLAIEPMLMAGGGDDFQVAPDGWALRTVDGSRAAHAEHTVAITGGGPRILTLP